MNFKLFLFELFIVLVTKSPVYEAVICGGGVVRPGNACCGNVGYYSGTNTCCGGVVRPGNACCGNATTQVPIPVVVVSFELVVNVKKVMPVYQTCKQ
ncbi:unnamed protein product [Adineta ricciae]|uniref:Uncharacterized protein n=1 Tax=Adineta ricciae TaxID=249248 RepID=A0A815LIW2_ADIRI|nr:unnamed protein product [Adineta ricciae]